MKKLVMSVLLLAGVWMNLFAEEPTVSVENVTVRQRYPWNGLVDIDFEVLCNDTTRDLSILFSVQDRQSGEMLAVNTLSSSDVAITNRCFSAKAGRHRVTWDAGRDAPGTISSNITVTVRAGAVKYLVIDLSGGTNAASYPMTTLYSTPSGGWTDEYKTTKLVLRRINAGTFMMGSPSDELGRGKNEDLHQVTLTKPYYIGVFEVTQRQWQLVMGARPSYFSNKACYASRPVETVSYDMIRGSSAGAGWPDSSDVDAASFMGRLREKTGLFGFDLPTEAEWEYSCRAGTATALNSGKNLTSTSNDVNMAEVGRYYYNGEGYYNIQSDNTQSDTNVGTAAVGMYKPNAWGLYDMHGNVWELCLDGQIESLGTKDVTNPTGGRGNERERRGGSYFCSPVFCRSAQRQSFSSSSVYRDIGFRLVCHSDTQTSKGNGDWYVDATNGNDSADGRSAVTAKKTIQSAVDAASAGQTILVMPGIYAPISTANKAVTIRGVYGAEKTIIDGGGTNRCVKVGTLFMTLPSETNTVLIGLTLQNGRTGQGGGAVGGTFRRCIVQGCWATNGATPVGGGGLARAIAYGCVLRNNYCADDGGAATYCRLYDCLVVGNRSDNLGTMSAGGGMTASVAYNCTVVSNVSAKAGTAIDCSTIYNCIVYGNICDGVAADIGHGTTNYNSIVGTDPQFVDAANGDYRLLATSPCIDAGCNTNVSTLVDLDGNARVIGAAVDQGAYEYGQEIVGVDSWYVDATNGSDSADGRSAVTAKRTIQSAVDAASAGQTILVMPGIYAPISTANKAVTIRGVYGAEKTIIDGGGTNLCVCVGLGPSILTNTVLCGLTIRNGNNWSGEGGGVSGGTLIDCVLYNNVATGGGGAAYANLYRCVLRNNDAHDDGGGADFSTLHDCLVVNNFASNSGGKDSGGGIKGCQAYNCTIANNAASSGGAGSACSATYNCIIYNNESYLSTNWNAYVDNPLFVDVANGDYRLLATSPCIDAGCNTNVSTLVDLDGNARVIGVAVDQGAYEYGQEIVGVNSWYVDATNGSDFADGRSAMTAKRTIQAAVDVATAGQTILVMPGTYGPIVTANKAVIIRGVYGAEKTIIDGGGTNRCATIATTNTNALPSGASTVLIGLTLQNGSAGEGGGALGGTLRRCVVQGCWSTDPKTSAGGGGLLWSIAYGCILRGNSCMDDGGGAAYSILYDCLVVGNSSENRGGGFAGAGMTRSRAYNCTVVANVSALASYGTAVDMSTVYNCIIYGNYHENGATADVCNTTSYNSIVGTDPQFVDAANGDYRLRAASPCINAGDNAFAWFSADLDGNARVAGATVDQGAYEFGSAGVGSTEGDSDAYICAEKASPTFPLDTRTGTRVSRATENITYSTEWNGTSSCAVKAGNAVLKSVSAAEEGFFSWYPEPGYYTLTHQAGSDTLAAEFVVLGSVASGDMTYWYTVKDGKALLWDVEPDTFVGTAVIPATMGGYAVTGIGSNAFAGCAGLTGVSIPASVADIDPAAFSGCGGITSLTLPEPSSVANLAAVFPVGITNIVFSGTEVPAYICKGFSNLVSVTVSAGVTNIGQYAFSGCGALASVTIASSVARIGENAFNGTGLWNTAFDGLFYVDNWLCGRKNYTPAGVLGIPSGARGIADSVFLGCSNLVSVAMPSSVASIGWSAFSGCVSLVSAPLPEGLRDIGQSAFVNCRSLASVSIPSGVAEISAYAFSGCTSLVSVVMQEGLERIGQFAFVNCRSLTSAPIPDSVTGIGNAAFGTGFSGSGLYRAASNGLFIVDGWVCGRKNYNPDGGLVLPDGVRGIAASAFYPCGLVTSITVPASVAHIGDNAFAGCVKLQAVYFLGDAPMTGTSLYDNTPATLTNYVTYATTGWNGTAGSAILPASWQDRPLTCWFYPVTFNLGGYGTRAGGGELSQSVGYGSAAAAPSVAVESGWEFTGWDKEFSAVTNILTVSAIYTRIRERWSDISRESVKGGTNYWGETVSLSAPSNEVCGLTNYVYTGWVGTGSVPASGTGTNVTFVITNATTVAWVWETNYWLAVTANGSGTVDAAGGWMTKGTNITLTAAAAAHWHFAGWIGDLDGCVVSGTSLTAPMDMPRSVRSVFAIDTVSVSFDLGVHGSRTGGGALTQTVDYGFAATAPAVAAEPGWEFTGWGKDFSAVTNILTVSAIYTRIRERWSDISRESVKGGTNYWGETVSLSAPSNEVCGLTNYVCAGWVGTGSAPASGTGTNVTFVITNATTVAWVWETNYWLAVTANGSGTVDAAGGWMTKGTNITLTAAAAAHWHFGSWAGGTNGCTASGNTLAVPIDAPRAVEAVFAIDTVSVTFDLGAYGYRTGGGALVQAVGYGSAAAAPSVAGFAGWGFAGWDKEFSGVTAPLTVSALYTPVVYAITYIDPQSAANSNPASYTVTNGVVFAPLSKEGWVFKGWEPVAIASGTTGPVTVTAQWEKVVETWTEIFRESTTHGTAYWNDMVILAAPSSDVDGLTNYIYTGWTGIGSAPASGTGTSVSFIITNTTTVVWTWETNYWLGVSTSGSGTVGTVSGWIPKGTNVTLTAAAAAHWHFTGWTGGTNGCTASGNTLAVPIDAPRAVEAVFAVDTFPVTFNLGVHGNRTGGGALTQTVGYGSAASAPVVAADSGWAFTGWNKGFSSVTNALAVAADYTAIPYEITYIDPQGATNLNPASYTVTNGVVFAPLGKKGWVFKGWEPASIAFGSTGRVTVTARWEKAVEPWTETSRGLTSSGTAYWGETVSLSAPSNEVCGLTNYICAGWVGTGSVPASGTGTNVTFVITNATTVAWVWETNYWLAVTANGSGTVDAAGGWMTKGTNITLTAAAAAHWHFAGWIGDLDGCVVSGTSLTAPMDMPRSVRSVFAIDTVSVSFDLGVHGSRTGGGALTQTVDYGFAATAPAVAAEPGWEFTGWGKDFSAVTNILTVSAIYTRIRERWSDISRESVKGGTNYWGETVSLSAPSNEVCGLTNYVCAGWVGTGSAPASGTGTNVTFVITNATTVAWVWETNYWLAVTANGSGTVDAAGGWMTKGTNIMLTAAAAAHWHFGSWAGGTNGCTASGNTLAVPIDAPRAVEAVFAVDTFPVTFNLGRHGSQTGGGVLAQTVGYGSTAVAPSVVADPGWTFVGWDKEFSDVTAPLTVSALYAPIVYTITYVDLFGARNPNPSVYTVMDAVSFAPLADRVGWVFAGWNPAAVAAGTTGDLTVSAVWVDVRIPDVSCTGLNGAAVYRDGTLTVDGSVSGNGRTAGMTLTTRSNGRLVFRWNVSSEKDADYARYALDGTVLAERSGKANGWEWVTNTVADGGKHVWTFTYEKDAGDSAGEDKAWFADIAWQVLWPLTVTNGSAGCDSAYFTDKVTVSAESRMPEWAFDRWIGDTNLLEDVTSSTAAFIMPNAPVTLTATYRTRMHNVSVSGGAGGGDYLAGSLVVVSANDMGRYTWFDRWIGDTQYAAKVTAPEMVFEMPDAPVALTATYATTVAGSRAAECIGRAFEITNAVTVVGETSAASITTNVVTLSGLTMGNGKSAGFSLATEGNGSLVFRWNVSSESGADFARYVLDGVERASRSGKKNGWEWVTNTVTDGGTHIWTFSYTKDGQDSAGDDTAWFADVSWTPSAQTATSHSPVPVPFAWLDGFGLAKGGDYEAAATNVWANGLAGWESYVAGLAPTNGASRLEVLIDGDRKVSWTPDLGAERKYTVLGKASLTDGLDWAPTNSASRFFKVKVEMP